MLNPFDGSRDSDRLGTFTSAVTGPSDGRARAVVDTVIGAGLTAALVYAIAYLAEWRWQIPMPYVIGPALAYVLVSGVVVFEVRADQLGRDGGRLDNPARWTDDVNRMLVVVHAFMLPGRIAGAPLIRGLWGLIASVVPASRSSLPPLRPPAPEAPMRPLRRATPPPARRGSKRGQ
jgi:hypothetical protein